MLDESKLGRKSDKGEIEHAPTHSIVTGKRLPSSGFVTLPIGGGYFVRYTGQDSHKVNGDFIAELRKSARPVQRKKVVKEGKDE